MSYKEISEVNVQAGMCGQYHIDNMSIVSPCDHTDIRSVLHWHADSAAMSICTYTHSTDYSYIALGTYIDKYHRMESFVL